MLKGYSGKLGHGQCLIALIPSLTVVSLTNTFKNNHRHLITDSSLIQKVIYIISKEQMSFSTQQEEANPHLSDLYVMSVCLVSCAIMRSVVLPGLIQQMRFYISFFKIFVALFIAQRPLEPLEQICQ